MGMETPAPTRAPTRPPTLAPTRLPTRSPTRLPTAYPTQKRGAMDVKPVATTSAPVSNPPASSFTNSPTVPTFTNPQTFTPTTFPPVATTFAPVTAAPSTGAPTTTAPSFPPSAAPTIKVSEVPTVSPSASPSEAPIIEINTGTPVAPISPTPVPVTTMQLQEFSILLISPDSVLNVKQLDLSLESYLSSTMMIENLESVTLTPISASSAGGSNFTATSIRFAGTTTFSVELPTSSVLFASQDGVLKSISGIQSVISSNPNLVGVRVIQVSFEPLDATTLVEGDSPSQTNTDESKNSAAIAVPIVLVLSLAVIAAGFLIIRRRRSNLAGPAAQSTPYEPPIKTYDFSASEYPDIEKIETTQKESVNTPIDDDESDGDADLSSYIMTATPTSVAPSTNVVIQSTVIHQRPEEINVSHIEDASEDGYLSTDDESARFGATDMSECTFKG